MDETKDHIPSIKFSGKVSDDFQLWKQKVIFALQIKDLEDYVICPIPDDATQQQIKNDRRAKALICLSLNDNVLPAVLDMKSAFDVWQLLLNRYQVFSRTQKARARKEFWSAEKSDLNVQDFATLLQTRAAALNVAGGTISEDEMVDKLIFSLPDDFDSVTLQFENERNLSLAKILPALISKEAQLKERNEASSIKVNANLSRIEELEKKLQQALQNSRPVCNHCKKKGHTENRCWNLHPEMRPQNNTTPQNVRSYPQSVCFSGTNFLDHKNTQSDWILDCGCSHHMSPIVLNQHKIDSTRYRGVEMGNNQVVPISGKGSALVELKTVNLDLQDVLHVPDLGKNLLSIGQSTGMGVKYLFDGNECKVYDDTAKLIFSSEPRATIPKGEDNLYHTSCAISKSDKHLSNFAQRSLSDLSAELWHQRLGHLNLSDLKILARNPESKMSM